MSMPKVSVIGLGYIGLPTAAAFASRKVHVLGVDTNPEVVSTINGGGIHIVEPDLDMIVQAAVAEGYLKAATKPEPADVFLVAVPTPFKGSSYEPDISYVERAAEALAPELKPGNLVILESTSPVGTTEKLSEWLADARPDLTFPQTHGEESDIRVAHCPERVLPGNIVRELVENDRIIGGMTPRCSAEAAKMYKYFVRGACIETTCGTAELCKLVENAYRDVNIAFANELSMICGELDIDIWNLISLANRHPRVEILRPGPGVGGHCLAVDPWFIVSGLPKTAKLIRQAREVNLSKPKYVVELVRNAASDGAKTHIAILGLAYKPNIDDFRESPAIEVVRSLASSPNIVLNVVDPYLKELPGDLQAMGVQLAGLDDALANSSMLVGLVAHSEFKSIQFRDLQAMKVLDVAGIWESGRS